MVGYRRWCWPKLRGTLDQELESAHKVIVLWSRASIGSPFVLHEAITGRDAGKLIQVKTSDIQVSDIPRPLRAERLLDARDLEGIARACSDDEGANELPIETMLSKRRQLGRQGDVGPALRSEATTARRPPDMDVPPTEVGRPRAAPSDPERTGSVVELGRVHPHHVNQRDQEPRWLP